MESLAPQRISANMRRFAEHGIDHNNPEHVAAYLLARQTTTRPRPEHILSILKSAKTSSKMGFELCDEYYLVPKGNMTEEAVHALGRYFLSEEELAKRATSPHDTNLSAVWIIDGSCPREHLGPGIKSMFFRELWVSRGRTVCPPGGSESSVEHGASPYFLPILSTCSRCSPSSCIMSWTCSRH